MLNHSKNFFHVIINKTYFIVVEQRENFSIEYEGE